MARPQFAPPPDDLGVVESVLRAPTRSTLPLSRLAPEQALRRLELTIVRRMEGFLQGDHRGLLPGPGSEASEARLYVPGQDDVRRMDWAVTARTMTPHVRDTIADRELEVWALLDVTLHELGHRGVTKRDLGIAAIATIGFLSQRMGDRFGGFIMRPEVIRRIPARSGRMALYSLLRRMLTEPIVPTAAWARSSVWRPALSKLTRLQRRRGCGGGLGLPEPRRDRTGPERGTPWERALRRLAVKNQVLAVEVVDRREVEFPDVGDILIKDPESSFQRYVNTSDAATRERFNAASAAQRDRIRASLRRAGVGHIQLRTDRDWVHDIARFVLAYRRTASVLHTPPQGVTR